MTTTSNVETQDDVHRLVETAIELGDQVEKLQEQLQEKLGIAKVVGGLETRTDKIETLQQRLRKWGKLVVLGLILDLTLTVGLGGLFNKVNNNTDAVAKVQDVVSKEVLCPVYGVVLSAGYHPERHTDDLEAYNSAWKVFQDGNKKLNCPGPAVGK